MMRTALLLSLLAVAASGCNLAFGTPYPGAATRYREFVSCASVSGSVCYGPSVQSETGGGGASGYVAGMSMGVEAGQFAGNDGSGMAFDVRAEYAYSLSSWLSLGAFGGVGFTAGGIDDPATDDDPDLVVRRIPLGAQVTLAPTPPVILRAAALAAPTSIRVGEQDAVSTTALGFTAGGGLSVPFPGLHFVLMFEWQHLRSSDITVNGATGDLSSNVYLFSYWLVL